MNEYEKYYRERLYPFQDGILNIAKRIGTPFYLTGGTAISRHYSPVRYSDDLDLFVNRDGDFHNWTERLYSELEIESRRGSFDILYDRIARYEDYVQLFLKQQPIHQNEGTMLKIDLINDVAAHYGDIESDEILGKVDSWRNILSNKISALYRIEPKDVIDLWTLAKIKAFDWGEIIKEASSKEAGLDPLLIYDLLKSFPREELSTIKWAGRMPDEDLLFSELSIMAEEIFEGLDNGLFKQN